MVNAALIDETLFAYDLDTLGKQYVGVGKDTEIWEKLAARFGGKPTQHAQVNNLVKAPTAWVSKYARQDVHTTLLLHQWQQDEIARQDAIDREESSARCGLADVVRLEQRLLPVLVRMERVGIRVNVPAAEKLLVVTNKDIEDNYKKIQRMTGNDDININSAKQIRDLFKPEKDGDGVWHLSDGTRAEETEAGNPSIDSPTMRKMTDPRAALIIEQRALIKMAGTFLRGHIIGNARSNGNGVHTVHCNFNQCRSENDLGTVTGRLSVNDPALHQIHKRNRQMASQVRGLFLPHGDDRWLCFDWNQFEFRWFAHYLKDKKINALYAADENTDFHQMVADLTKLPRSARHPGDPNAKQIDLGLVFGMGQGRMAQEIGLPYTTETNSRGKEYLLPGPEAVSIFEQYHAAVPGIGKLLDDAAAVARTRTYVKTVMGRHLRFPKGIGAHKAGGLIFQGSSADSMKQKLIEIDEYINSGEVRDGDLRLLLSVHDEVDLSCTRSDRDRRYDRDLQHILQTFDGVECPIKCKTPIRADGGFGDTWWIACSDEATQYKENK
jgi:DNA polymerase-1